MRTSLLSISYSSLLELDYPRDRTKEVVSGVAFAADVVQPMDVPDHASPPPSPPPRRSARRRYKSIPHPSLSPEVSTRVHNKGKRRAATPEEPVVTDHSSASDRHADEERMRKRVRLTDESNPSDSEKTKGAANSRTKDHGSVSSPVPVLAPMAFTDVSNASLSRSSWNPATVGRAPVVLHQGPMADNVAMSAHRLTTLCDDFTRSCHQLCEKLNHKEDLVPHPIPVTIARGSEEYIVLLEDSNKIYRKLLVEHRVCVKKQAETVEMLGRSIKDLIIYTECASRDVTGMPVA